MKILIKLIALTLLIAHLASCGFAAITRYSADHDIPLAHLPDKASVLSRMGRPNRIECKSANQETWSYISNLRWKGVFLWALIVPVPLMAPIGRDERYFTFEGEHTTSIKSNEVINCSASFFIAPSNPIGRSGADSGCTFYEFQNADAPIVSNIDAICKDSTAK